MIHLTKFDSNKTLLELDGTSQCCPSPSNSSDPSRLLQNLTYTKVSDESNMVNVYNIC